MSDFDQPGDGEPVTPAPQDSAGGVPAEPVVGDLNEDLNPETEIVDAPAQGAADAVPPTEITVETLIEDLERVTNERDQYQRVAAEYANFRKQSEKRQSDLASFAAAGTVEKLLPVLDACDGALLQGATDVAPIHTLLLDTLTSLGLVRLGEPGVAFDPNQHEAVMTEPAQPGDVGQVVTEVLRSGYGLNGRTLRAAMVKVRG